MRAIANISCYDENTNIDGKMQSYAKLNSCLGILHLKGNSLFFSGHNLRVLYSENQEKFTCSKVSTSSCCWEIFATLKKKTKMKKKSQLLSNITRNHTI